MKLLYADETAVEQSQGEFFIYGGAIVPSEKALVLHEGLWDIARSLPPEARPLKWNLKVKGASPQLVAAHHEATLEALELAAEHGVVLFFVVILHAIARKNGKRGRQISTLVHRFNTYCERCKEPGLVLLDTYTENEEEGGGRLRDVAKTLFSEGIDFPGGRYSLSSTVGIHEAHTGASHFSSLVDLALNALRTIVNEEEGKKGKHADRIVGILQKLLPKLETGVISNLVAVATPKEIRVPAYEQRYKEMFARLKRYGLPLSYDDGPSPSDKFAEEMATFLSKRAKMRGIEIDSYIAQVDLGPGGPSETFHAGDSPTLALERAKSWLNEEVEAYLEKNRPDFDQDVDSPHDVSGPAPAGSILPVSPDGPFDEPSDTLTVRGSYGNYRLDWS